MRGKEDDEEESSEPTGITPTYAGKRAFASACTASHQDHPHVCGEKEEYPAELPDGVGSPLRMRGKAPVCKF